MPRNARTADEDLDRTALWSVVSAGVPAAVPAATAPPSAAQQAPLVVTTSADVVDADDGVLSLREAVLAANERLGSDIITFASDLRGGTIELTGGSLVITDDLRIDGDPLNGGPDGIVIDGVFRATQPVIGGAEVAFEVQGVEARFEDLTVRGAGYNLIRGTDADIAIERALIHENNPFFTGSTAIKTIGGSLEISDSSVRDIFGGIEWATLVDFTDTTVTIERSLLTGGQAISVTGIRGSGDLQITDSAVVDMQAPSFGTGISMVGNLVIERSLIAGTGGTAAATGRGIVIDGALQLINSTVAATGGGEYRDDSGGIIVAPGSRAVLVNSTLSGTYDQQSAVGAGSEAPSAVPIVGLRVAPGSTVTIANSVIDDRIEGTIASNGANTFRDVAVDGATATDRLGVRAEQLFASTAEIGSSGIRTGVVADNGGPTGTIALAPRATNPAIGAGIAADAVDAAGNPLAVDQRGPGFARIAQGSLDLGAFELQIPTQPVVLPEPPLIVTTLDDVVDPDDGLLSLREAVAAANGLPGTDIITFAGALAGGTSLLTGGPLSITDELILEGSGVTLAGRASGALLEVLQTAAQIGDLALEGAVDGAAIRAVDSELLVSDARITGNAGPGIGVVGSRLGMVDSIVAENGAAGIDAARSLLGIADSRIADNAADGIAATDSNVALFAGTVDGNGNIGIDLAAGSLRVVDSAVGGNAQAGIVTGRDNVAVIETSRVDGNGALGIDAGGDLAVLRSSVSLNGATPSFLARGGITARGDLLVSDSTVAGNISNADAGGIDAVGFPGARAVIVNSTIADNSVVDTAVASAYAPGGIGFRFGVEGEVINATITGNLGRRTGTDPLPPQVAAGGIAATEGSVVTVANTIVVGNEVAAGTPGADDVVGAVSSRGFNLFGQAAVPGQLASDRTGVDGAAVFAATELLPNGTAAGVLADNGGPTPTAALLDDAANPALDRADPAAAPPTDQRGLIRDATPDIGAFELGASGEPSPPAPSLPELAEKVPLADADILGAPRSFLTLVGGDAAIGFVDESAAFQSSLGVYLVGPDGSIDSPRWAFERIEHAEPSDAASEQARPGGGPLAPGDAVLLSDLFDPADLGPGVEFGLFLVADGWTSNPTAIFDLGTLEFRTGDAAASVADVTPELFHIAENGAERLVLGDIMHTVDAGSANPLSNTLNPGGTGQVTSGTLDGLFTVAFEDKPLAASDRDFNDAIFAVQLLDATDDPFTVAVAADAAAVPAGGATLDTLLTTAETA